MSTINTQSSQPVEMEKWAWVTWREDVKSEQFGEAVMSGCFCWRKGRGPRMQVETSREGRCHHRVCFCTFSQTCEELRHSVYRPGTLCLKQILGRRFKRKDRGWAASPLIYLALTTGNIPKNGSEVVTTWANELVSGGRALMWSGPQFMLLRVWPYYSCCLFLLQWITFPGNLLGAIALKQ